MKAVLFRSQDRFSAFLSKLKEYEIECTILDFEGHEWIGFDYNTIDFLIYYPSFEYSSNHPLALQKVYDNLLFIHSEHPHLVMFPDPNGIKYYNDKYKQYLFLSQHSYPTPETIPLLSENSLDLAEKKLGYPMVIKNRYGAGGNSVFKVHNKKELRRYYNLSTLNLFNIDSAKYFAKMFSKRIFYYHLIREKRANYPFLSPPLLAQKFITIDRDLKTVVGDGQVVEAHWRYQADPSMWKMNIDGGGTGVWGYIPDEALELSVRLAKDLKVRWLNLDLMMSDGKFLISEFSPVWHHYKYKEKLSFVYRDDYNIDVPLKISLDFERIIIESLIKAARERVRGERSKER